MKKKAISRETETRTVNKIEKFCSWKWLQVENAMILCHAWKKHCFPNWGGGGGEVVFLLVLKVYLLLFCWARFWACEKLTPIHLISSAPLVLTEVPQVPGERGAMVPSVPFVCSACHSQSRLSGRRGIALTERLLEHLRLSVYRIQDLRFIYYKL